MLAQYQAMLDAHWANTDLHSAILLSQCWPPAGRVVMKVSLCQHGQNLTLWQQLQQLLPCVVLSAWAVTYDRSAAGSYLVHGEQEWVVAAALGVHDTPTGICILHLAPYQKNPTAGFGCWGSRKPTVAKCQRHAEDWLQKFGRALYCLQQVRQLIIYILWT